MASDKIEVLAHEAMPEYDNPEDLLDAVVSDYGELSIIEDDLPKQYVVYYTGSRGTSKTMRLAWHCLRGLRNGENVFTNIELYPEAAKKIGITKQANPVDLDFLLSFDESLTDAVIAISEIDTWFDRMRESSTANRLGGKFLQQLRKKGLRIFLDTQDYLPGVLMRQVDKLVYCNDFHFTRWGRERNLPRGMAFFYDCYDYSGAFTGWRGYHWRETFYHGERMWPLFNSYQIHDPFKFGAKLKIVGGDREYDVGTKQFYALGERRETKVNEEREISTQLFQDWAASGFLQELQEHNAITPDPLSDPVEGYLRISTHGAKKSTSSEIAKKQYEDLWAHIREGRGAQLIGAGKFIRIRRPFISEEPNENYDN